MGTYKIMTLKNTSKKKINNLINNYNESYFTLLNIPENYIINNNKINRYYQNKMKKWHPDSFKNISEKNKEKIEKIASDINFSRKILNDDLQRAKHLLYL